MEPRNYSFVEAFRGDFPQSVYKNKLSLGRFVLFQCMSFIGGFTELRAHIQYTNQYLALTILESGILKMYGIKGL